jgi:Ca2+:H+ antiporter
VLVTAGAGAARYVAGTPAILAFLVAMVALGGLAWIVSMATEQVGERLSTAVTGTLQSSIGNLPEFFVVLFALQAGDKIVAETAILGSILTNALLVLGTVLIAGALRSKDGIMRFSPRLPNDTATLLLVASFIIALLATVNVVHDPAAQHTRTISIVGAVAILAVYGMWLRQYLTKPDPAVATTESDGARLSAALSLGLLITGGVGSAFVSDWFVHALEPTIHSLHISQAFAGLVIVAIAGNAVEHAAGIVLAIRGRSDLAIAVVKSSVAQIAAFMYPLLVLVSLLTTTHLTFALAPIYVASLIATAILLWQITGDGEATPFEGAALIAVFVAIATVAAFEH